VAPPRRAATAGLSGRAGGRNRGRDKHPGRRAHGVLEGQRLRRVAALTTEACRRRAARPGEGLS
jgi:hypothetical protein